VAGSHNSGNISITSNLGSINATWLVECRPCDPIVLTRHLQQVKLQPKTFGQYFECIGKLHKLQSGLYFYTCKGMSKEGSGFILRKANFVS
jgi:hypothetical protein